MATGQVGRKKEDFSPQAHVFVKAVAKVLYNGDEEAAWRDVFAEADNTERAIAESEQRRGTARLHLKATHGA